MKSHEASEIKDRNMPEESQKKKRMRFLIVAPWIALRRLEFLLFTMLESPFSILKRKNLIFNKKRWSRELLDRFPSWLQNQCPKKVGLSLSRCLQVTYGHRWRSMIHIWNSACLRILLTHPKVKLTPLGKGQFEIAWVLLVLLGF